jgi:hypothetical protein
MLSPEESTQLVRAQAARILELERDCNEIGRALEDERQVVSVMTHTMEPSDFGAETD